MRVSDGNLLVGMNNCDTSRKDKTLFNAADATGEYDLDLQVKVLRSRVRDPERQRVSKSWFRH